ncbi:MAG: FG-GAP repeat domain-containing protein [Myxococcota bacterium]
MKFIFLRSVLILGLLSGACSSEPGVTPPEDVGAAIDVSPPGTETSQGDTGSAEPDVSIELDGNTESDVTSEPDVTGEPDTTTEPDTTIELDVTPEPDVMPEADVIPEADVTPEPDVTSEDADLGPVDAVDDASEATEDAEGDVTEEPDVPVGPQPCDPPLALTPDVGFATPYGLFLMSPSGGTGAYLFELADPDSNGLLNPFSGSYLAPGTVGVSDTVRLIDEGCVGEATGVIHVVEPFQAVPNTVEISSGQSMTFTTIGGSPEQYFEVVHAPSGGTITLDGLYTAGPVATTDLLRGVDAQTGQHFDITVTVVEEAVLTPRPGVIALPLDSTYDVQIEGGSGHFTLTPEDPFVVVEGTTLSGETEGQTTLNVEDMFTGLTTTLSVTVMAPLEFAVERAGDGSYEGIMLSPGDINGDGYNDALLALREADIEAFDSGAVYIYSGTAEGLSPAPARIISLPGRREFFGRGADLGDVNGDGLIDLIVGADGHDAGAVDNGAVFVYLGVEGKFFEATASTVLPGVYGYDRSGFSITVCDFNGDGFQDIASGTIYAEDRDIDDYPTSQGAVYVYLGSEDGFGLEPDDAIYGMIPQPDESYAGVQNLRFADQIASGDVDNDGLCDLVGSAYRWGATSGSSNDGYIAVYRGQAPSADGPGGLEPLPSKLIGAIDPTNQKSQAGRRLSVGDVNGDGYADIAFSQYQWNNPEASGLNHGALRLFLGGPLSEEAPTEFEPTTAADRTWIGASSYDGFGWLARIAEVNGEPPMDLITSSTNGEGPEGPNSTGDVSVYFGVQGGLPSETADIYVAGELGGDIFGLTAAGLGDVTGDGIGDLLIMAGRNDEIGIDVGRPYLFPGAPEAQLIKLDLPGEPAGSEVGRDVSLIDDLNGDGFPEALVGAPHADRVALANNATNVGSVALYQGRAQGHVAEPKQHIEGFVGHSSGDRLGMRVDNARDFDGDGLSDVAILSRYDDRPGTYPSAWVSDGECSGSFSNGGAVYIFSSVVCGDGTCSADEDCGSCEADCGACPEGKLGSAPGSAPWIASTPTFVWMGTQLGQSMRAMSADMDINGDGLGDFIAGGLDWDAPGASAAGGFSVVFGRPALVDDSPVVGEKTIEICGEEASFVGLRNNDYLGGWDGLTSMGYLNDDNCEDFAVGAYVEDFANSSQGTVRIFFGWGGDGCPEAPTYVLLAPLLNGGQSGYSLDGGHDATGDGIPDLLVGGHRLTVNGDSTGAAWLVSGDYIRSLPTELFINGADPDVIHPYIPTNFGLQGVWRIDGQVDDEYFGASVALVPNLSAPGRAGLAVGGTFGDVGGTKRAGGVRLYGVHEGVGGIVLDPVAEVAGESWREGGQFGSDLSAVESGDGAQLLIGALEGSSQGLDQGSVYSLTLSP